MVESVAVIIMKQRKVLIVKKDSSHKLAGLWEFPGGKLENSETLEACIHREMMEELLISVRVMKHLTTYTFDLERFMLKINAFIVELVTPEIILKEHSEMRWVSIDELSAFEFVPSDYPTVEAIQNMSISLA